MGFQHEVISPEALSGIWRTLLGNGMTTGSIIEILLTLLLEMPQLRRRRHLDVTLDYSALPEIDEYLRAFASRVGWDRASTDRLRSAGEETLLSLMQGNQEEANGRRLAVSAHLSDGTSELEFIAASEEES